ncbi:hypothetical protein EPN42_02640 [bacterium]|nr:MAG: hypothetical protein EPN42_02640 [bacterium]
MHEETFTLGAVTLRCAIGDEQAYIWSSAMWGAEVIPVSVLWNAQENLRSYYHKDSAVYTVPPHELVANGDVSLARLKEAIVRALRAMGGDERAVEEIEGGFGWVGMPGDYHGGIRKAIEKMQDLIAFGPGAAAPPRIEASHAQTFLLALRAVLFAFRGNGELLFPPWRWRSASSRSWLRSFRRRAEAEFAAQQRQQLTGTRQAAQRLAAGRQTQFDREPLPQRADAPPAQLQGIGTTVS